MSERKTPAELAQEQDLSGMKCPDTTNAMKIMSLPTREEFDEAMNIFRDISGLYEEEESIESFEETLPRLYRMLLGQERGLLRKAVQAKRMAEETLLEELEFLEKVVQEHQDLDQYFAHCLDTYQEKPSTNLVQRTETMLRRRSRDNNYMLQFVQPNLARCRGELWRTQAHLKVALSALFEVDKRSTPSPPSNVVRLPPLQTPSLSPSSSSTMSTLEPPGPRTPDSPLAELYPGATSLKGYTPELDEGLEEVTH